MKTLQLFTAAICAALLSTAAFAQTTGTITLTPSVTSGNGSISTTLTWSVQPTPLNCVASGHPAWTGSKAASGTQVLPVITMSGTYPLTLACTWQGDTQARVSWTAPVTNTDGSALAKCATQTTAGPCLQMFRILRSTSASMASPEMTPVNDRNATSHTLTGLSVGSHYFAVEAVNGNGVPSELSNITSKTITAAVSRTESVTITVNPKPQAPVVTIE